METVEVFKTNVETGEQAEQLITLIVQNSPQYAVNFDLDDCDRILRVKSSISIQEASLIAILQKNGYDAAVLSDEIPPFIGNPLTLSAR
jgi:hypothetical protein